MRRIIPDALHRAADAVVLALQPLLLAQEADPRAVLHQQPVEGLRIGKRRVIGQRGMKTPMARWMMTIAPMVVLQSRENPVPHLKAVVRDLQRVIMVGIAIAENRNRQGKIMWILSHLMI
jgi:hypothetical protein